ncbi:hypothetical protein JDV09_16975 [Mycobacterium sp. Y57]|uniref:hypothetical protein n=1 Tax=Mycolicibacterium xanthum TaxID=2796469 RepID=UPI001C8530E8|nr:hypothetical protein [Mycolicibacterium xanthum]MBX7433787.1 hypothetical protein [Mycolicibacterium xanthum]
MQVEVLKLGTQRPPRVQVRWVDESFEGRQEWVPPARLKVRWEAVDGFRTSEAHWDRIFELGRGFDDPYDGAATEVFDALIAREVARMEYREAGACRITDPARLGELTGLDSAVWAECPDRFTAGDDLVVPWPVTEQIAAAVARRNPTPILENVHNEENEARYQAIHGHRYRGRGANPDHVIPPEICIHVDSKLGKPRRAILGQWCGVEAADRFDELVELRKEIHRVGQIAEAAIAALRKAGHKPEAEHLARQLGTPVEMLRHHDSS